MTASRTSVLLRPRTSALLRGFARSVLRVASTVVRPVRQVVVYGYPETEGNAIEVAGALLRSYPGDVVWLSLDGGSAVARYAHDEKLKIVPKNSWRGVLAYLQAEAVFFTHGLYGSPRPVRRKPLINLWHGDGPKGHAMGGRQVIPSTYLIGSTCLFSNATARLFGVAPEKVLLTGNPRTDQFWRPVDADALTGLGITLPFVVWMPTFRRAAAIGRTAAWSDTSSLQSNDRLAAGVQTLGERLQQSGVQLVIKPHPMDAEDRRIPGSTVVTNASLSSSGVDLYSLLGASAGLVTDYSSVWVDYLLLDRPLGFLMSDREEYENGRGLEPPDVLDWLPGTDIDDMSSIEEFVEDVVSGGSGTLSLRAAARARVGLVESQQGAQDLVSVLQKRSIISS